MLTQKKILLCVTGGIAAYKAANLTSLLLKSGCNVKVIMTENAAKFIHPTVFETLTGSKCYIDTFDRNFQFDVEHISLAKWADAVLVAPATANIIAKLANGIADDMVSTTLLACRCVKVVAPAMNTAMYENQIVQDNLKKLEHYGFQVITPASGLLACKDSGIGKLPAETHLILCLKRALTPKDYFGRKILVTAGPTQEPLDPVRYLTNHSSGKMGYELATAAMMRGAEVTLISGPVSITPPPFVHVIPVTTAQSMYDAVMAYAPEQDVLIKAAAVADYTPAHTSSEKIKKSEASLTLNLSNTKDILAELGKQKHSNQFLCGFAMETSNLLENSRKKLIKKNADMIAANCLSEEGAGFGVATNHVTLITPTEEIDLGTLSKEATAHRLLDEIIKRMA